MKVRILISTIYERMNTASTDTDAIAIEALVNELIDNYDLVLKEGLQEEFELLCDRWNIQFLELVS